MVSPTEVTDLKRLGRYLKKCPDFAQVFPQQARPKFVKVEVDADHAGDVVTRRSTTGMIAFYGQQATCRVRSRCRLERVSTTLVKGGATGLGLTAESLLADFGIDVGVLIEGDSNAAKGTRPDT